MDRARPPVGHQREGLAQREREHLRAGGLEAALDVGAQDVDEVALEIAPGFLERPAVPLAGRHVPGDIEHRRGIGEGRGDRDDDVRGARAAGGIGRHGRSGDAEVALGHERRDRLVMHGHGLDLGLTVEEAVQETENAVTAEPEDVRHLLLDEEIRDVRRSRRCRPNAHGRAPCTLGRRDGPRLAPGATGGQEHSRRSPIRFA